ncbi:hypothetical protein [Rhizobium sp. ICMP 5592]|uniref:hypothetical protein n=1 Tax=Rhizobium sp. ICMP 5592 TaxID=2292445 RepID=UPI001296C1F2|nr:hypothetical protein [Rhizobium sp. ICMP 5592]MQB40486.1 hypothetical protein [Rhizobium sp. ICMP 5592]
MTNTSDPHQDGAEIHLSPDEAVVLFELLSRWCDSKAIHAHSPDSKCFESTAECAVLHNVLASLEKQLVAPFEEDYNQMVEEARRRLADLWNHLTLKG